MAVFISQLFHLFGLKETYLLYVLGYSLVLDFMVSFCPVCVVERLITENCNNTFSVCHMTLSVFPWAAVKCIHLSFPSCIIQIWLQRSGFLSKTCRFLLGPDQIEGQHQCGCVSSSPQLFLQPPFSESFSCAALIFLCYSFALQKCQLFLYERRGNYSPASV